MVSLIDRLVNYCPGSLLSRALLKINQYIHDQGLKYDSYPGETDDWEFLLTVPDLEMRLKLERRIYEKRETYLKSLEE